jgi:hypothetical protein
MNMPSFGASSGTECVYLGVGMRNGDAEASEQFVSNACVLARRLMGW